MLLLLWLVVMLVFTISEEVIAMIPIVVVCNTKRVQGVVKMCTGHTIDLTRRELHAHFCPFTIYDLVESRSNTMC